MTKQYIVVDYDSGKSDEPKIAFESDRLDSAQPEFETLIPANQTKSLVLFNTFSGKVEKIAILGEPIYLAKALRFARKYQSKSTLTKVGESAAKAIAGRVIGKIAEAIAGGPIEGVGGVVLGHFIAPYYAYKGDSVAMVKAVTGMTGGFSGTMIGLMVGGPFATFVGGVVGSLLVSESAGALLEFATQHPKCNTCSGTGLVKYFEVCEKCNGYGYKM